MCGGETQDFIVSQSRLYFNMNHIQTSYATVSLDNQPGSPTLALEDKLGAISEAGPSTSNNGGIQ